MRGITTVRDAGGNTAGLKRATDEGYVKGPRIYPSQAVIAQYSGHVDFRNPNFLPKEWSGRADPIEEIGLGMLCNGEQQVLAAARNNLYQGATQIKLAVSGGVISFTDPLYVYEFTENEIEAGVKAASDYGTFFVYAPSLNDVEIPDFPFCVGVFRLVHPPLGAMSSRLLFRRDLVPLSRTARCHVIPTAL